jgi:hypothetical protein
MIAVPAGDNTNLVGAYVAEKTGCEFTPGMFSAFAVLDDRGGFCAGVVVSEYRGYDCQLSCASDVRTAWRPHVIKAVFDYVFNQLGCIRCTALTRKNNRRTRAFLGGMGFTLEGRVRKGYDGVKDALVYGLLKEECVYIQEPDVGYIQIAAEAGRPEGEASPRNEEVSGQPAMALNGQLEGFF